MQAEEETPRPDHVFTSGSPTDGLPVSGLQDGTAPGVERQEIEKLSFWRWLGEVAVLLALAFALAFGIKTFVVQPFYIPSGSMEHTLEISDRVLVNKFIYRLRSPKPGDIVVFEAPESTSTDYIKRIIAVEGQTVDVRDGVVYVDGRALREPYVNRETPDDNANMMQAVKVPPGHVWLMGDNRGNSTDSRVFGAQPASRILGKAFAIYWPVNRVKGL